MSGLPMLPFGPFTRIMSPPAPRWLCFPKCQGPLCLLLEKAAIAADMLDRLCLTQTRHPFGRRVATTQ
jgi:hypothetical protein